MIKFLLSATMILGLGIARADEVAPPADAVMTDAQAAELNSFFEPRTLEDFEQMIKRDTAMTADTPAVVAGAEPN